MFELHHWHSFRRTFPLTHFIHLLVKIIKGLGNSKTLSVEQRLMLSFQIITIMIMGMVNTGEVTVTLTMRTTMGMRMITTAVVVMAEDMEQALGEEDHAEAPHL